MGEAPAAYRRCARRVRAEDPLTLAATYLLSPRRRRAVQAMEAFRLFVADVIAATPLADAGAGAAVLDRYAAALAAAGDGAPPAWPADAAWLPAVADTMVRAAIPTTTFADYLAARAREIRTATYPTWAAYDAALAAVAEPMAQMSVRFLDVSGTEHVVAARLMLAASESAYRLRCTAASRRNGRLYFPLEVLAAAGVDATTPDSDRRWRDVVRACVEDSRARHARAHTALTELMPRMARLAAVPLAVSDAWLDRIEARGFDVMDSEIVVGSAQTARAAVTHVLRGGAAARW